MRAELATAILRELDADYARVNRGKFPALADEWESALHDDWKASRRGVGERKLRGRAEALDDDGALLLRTEHGRLGG